MQYDTRRGVEGIQDTCPVFPYVTGVIYESMIFNQKFTLTLNGKYKGQQHINVLNGQVRNVLGVTTSQVCSDFNSVNLAVGGIPQCRLWLSKQSTAYKLESITCKSGVEESTRVAANLYNSGNGELFAGVNEAVVGVAQYVQLASSVLPRKYARGVYVPLTSVVYFGTDGYLTTLGSTDMSLIAGMFVNWSAQSPTDWYYSVSNSATLQTGTADVASYVNQVTLMGRRTARNAP